ncbi:MAG: glycosyltransferase family 2 protein [Candidatus Omnitrophota bacterium]
MRCDIIIPIWGQLDLTRECIERIFDTTRYPYRLILIDNASEDDTKKYLEGLRRERPDIVLVRNEHNLGFVKAVNQGLRLSDGQYVCVLNNDTIPATGWLESMAAFAQTHGDVGLINPQCDGHMDKTIELHAEELRSHRGEYMEMNQCQGFCMLIKREVIEKIGYLDESFGIGGFDDTDYSMRAHMAGYRSVSIKDAYVYHRLHGSFNKSGDREEWVRRNQKIYYDKWGKHKRIAVAAGIDPSDAGSVTNLVMFAYGLAREWSWVHIWLNTRRGKGKAVEAIARSCADNKLPPHQNIRIDHLDLPETLFRVVVFGKLLERMRKRMRDKRFDMVVASDRAVAKMASAFARAVNISFTESCADWQKRGRETALSIGRKRIS